MVSSGVNKRKKHHDKDKYYRLAKEQGFRSRAAFKLSQMNRKYNFLDDAKVVVDLCAAPGGWTQVISRSICSRDSLIIAVDILPMRPISSNVHRLIGDINTDKCQTMIKRELNTKKADTIVCDGAPNISGGGAFQKDSYVQNEMVLSALKCATKHLRQNGSFVTKVYRSRDYSALLWVVNQFFDHVQAVKPSSSRLSSSEIYWVCKSFKAPTQVDPKLLDARFVFEDFSSHEITNQDKKTSFKKLFGKKPTRVGYDMSKLDFSMRNIGYVTDFINCSDPIQMLVECTGLSFVCEECSSKKTNASCRCASLFNHEKTNDEIKLLVTDLQILSKSDFKSLLDWRKKLQVLEESSTKDSDSSSDEESKQEQDSSDEEEGIQQEIEQMKLKKLRKAKKNQKGGTKSIGEAASSCRDGYDATRR